MYSREHPASSLASVTVIMPSMVATVSTSGKCLKNYRAASIERSGKARGLDRTGSPPSGKMTTGRQSSGGQGTR